MIEEIKLENQQVNRRCVGHDGKTLTKQEIEGEKLAGEWHI